MNQFENILRFSGAVHFGILVASALTPKVLDWKHELASLHPFLRRLFWVYGTFIVIVIIGFGTLTLLGAEEMANGQPMARVLAGFIGVFWTARLAVQWFVFDARAFLKNTWIKVGYHFLTAAFIGLAVVYAIAAFRPTFILHHLL